MDDLYKKCEKFVIDSFMGQPSQIKHFERTVYWIKQLKPDVDLALEIAAMAHDIERAYKRNKPSSDFLSTEYLRIHEEGGAQVIAEFLEKEGADNKLVERVKLLVSRHEEGGDDDQNLLKDADSVSFFENNLEIFYEKVARLGKEKVRKKFDWMFSRITSEEAKEIARPWYEEGIKNLS